MRKTGSLKKNLFIAIILLIATAHVSIFACLNSENLGNFFDWISLSKDEQLKEAWGEYYEQFSFIKDITPKDSFIVLPPRGRAGLLGQGSLSIYFIFPRIIAGEGDKKIIWHNGPVYRVDIKWFKYTGKFLKKYFFDKGFSLLLLRERTGLPKTRLTDFTMISPNFFNTGAALIKLFLIFASGLYITLRHFKERSLLGTAATSFLVGIIFMSVLYIFFSLIGIVFTETLQFLILGLLSVPGILLIKRKKHNIFSFRNISSGNKLSLVIVFAFFTLIFLKSFFTPIATWDACAIWGARAKAIFALHTIRGSNLWGAHPQYPPLLPILMSQIAIGGERIVKLIFPVLALCLYINIYDEIRDTRFSEPLKRFLPILLFATPLFFTHSLIAYANLALAVFITKAVTIFSRALKKNETNLWLPLAIILCGVVLVRPEGNWYLLCAVLLGCLWFYIQKKPILYLGYFLIPICCSLLWAIEYKVILGGSFVSLVFGTPVFRKYLLFSEIMRPFTWANLNEVNFLLVKYATNFKFWGLIPASFVLICLLRARHIIKRYLPEISFMLLAFMAFSVYMYYRAPLWGSVQEFFAIVFNREFMPFISIMFIVLLKEIDYILNRATHISSEGAIKY